MSRTNARTCHADVWRKLGTNTAVKHAKKQAPEKWRLRASATTELARSPSEEQ